MNLQQFTCQMISLKMRSHLLYLEWSALFLTFPVMIRLWEFQIRILNFNKIVRRYQNVRISDMIKCAKWNIVILESVLWKLQLPIGHVFYWVLELNNSNVKHFLMISWELRVWESRFELRIGLSWANSFLACSQYVLGHHNMYMFSSNM